MSINLKNICNVLKITLSSFLVVVFLNGCTPKIFPELPNEELKKFGALTFVESYTDGDLNESTMRMEGATYAAIQCFNYTYLMYGKKAGLPAGTCISNTTGVPRTFSILRFLELTGLKIKDFQEAARLQQIEFKKRNSKLYEPGGENYPNDSQWEKTKSEKEQSQI